jgi:hypothetical protein
MRTARRSPFVLVMALVAMVVARSDRPLQALDDKAPVLSGRRVPIGSLGHRLGDYLTIEGTTTNGGAAKVGDYLMVTKVNGKELDKPEGINISGFNTVDLPDDARCVLKGYEDVRMVGQPPALFAAAREAGKPAPLRHAALWHLGHEFHVLSVVEPKDVAKPKD